MLKCTQRAYILSIGRPPWPQTYIAAVKKTDAGPPVDALTYLLDGIFRLERAVTRIGNHRLTPWRMSLSGYAAMHIIDSQPHLSLTQLSRRCFVRPQTMTRIVTSLRERGYVKRSASPDSERAMSLTLTNEGRAALKEMDGEVLRIREAFSETLNPAELEDLTRMLRVSAIRVEQDLRDLGQS